MAATLITANNCPNCESLKLALPHDWRNYVDEINSSTDPVEAMAVSSFADSYKKSLPMLVDMELGVTYVNTDEILINIEKHRSFEKEPDTETSI